MSIIYRSALEAANAIHEEHIATLHSADAGKEEALQLQVCVTGFRVMGNG